MPKEISPPPKTIGPDFLTKEVKFDGNVVPLQLWDTIDDQRFHSIGPSFYSNSKCCVLVCDLTDPKSFESIESYRSEFLNKLNPKNPETFFEEVDKLAFKRNSKEDDIFIPNKFDLKTTNQQTQTNGCCSV